MAKEFSYEQLRNALKILKLPADFNNSVLRAHADYANEQAREKAATEAEPEPHQPAAMLPHPSASVLPNIPAAMLPHPSAAVLPNLPAAMLQYPSLVNREIFSPDFPSKFSHSAICYSSKSHGYGSISPSLCSATDPTQLC